MTTRDQADRYHWLQRLLEMVPGVSSWAILIGPVWLSFSYPGLVAYFVLSFDFYWLCRALWLAWGVVVSYGRIRRVMEVDWLDRCVGLADPAARRADLAAALTRLERAGAQGSMGIVADAAIRSGELAAARRRIQRELGDLERASRLASPPPSWDEYTHVALIPTHTEPYGKLCETVRALAASHWPKERLVCAIITRETDAAGTLNVARLREEFGASFADFIHILDPLEPGIVVGKSSAMAWGGRFLYRLLVRERGMDASRILITDLDADYRVHPQYFAYLTWVHLTEANRDSQLYQPVPYFHNNIWDAPFAVRLVAAASTQLQLWRSAVPEKLISFSSYSTTLQMVHEVGYWATDAIPEDSRFYWKSYFTYGDRFRAVPLFIPIYGDAVRARGYTRSLVTQYMQIRRWAWGVTDIPFVVRNAISHREIPIGSRIWRIATLYAEHINWAIAPFILLFGSNLPLLLNPAFAQTTLGQNLPLYASSMFTLALAALLVLVVVEYRILPPRPAHWGPFTRLGSYVQYLALPVVGVLFSTLPALDAQTRLLTGRYLEYRVTEKA